MHGLPAHVPPAHRGPGRHEALTRFRTTDLARSPDRWFADAWAVALGFELEMSALERALAGAWRTGAGEMLSVNLSPAALTDPRFERRMAALAPLVVEVTEHAVVDDYRPLVGVLERLRAAGWRWMALAPVTPACATS